MAKVITGEKNIITRLTISRYFSSGTAAAVPVLARLLFGLVAVKLIATYGSDGSLTKWGIAQNAVTLLAALMGFSVQSGVAARAANGSDPHSFGRGLQILLVGTGVALLAAAFLLCLNDRGWDLPAISVVAVLSAASAGMGSLVSAYLPATGRVHTLSGFYIAVGAITCGLLLVVDTQHVDGLIIAIGVGWFGGALVFFSSSRQYRHRSFWHVQWDSKQTKKLLGYGLASLANATVQMGAILLIRDSVIETAGLQKSDFFESSLRLATLVEGVIGSVASIMLWRKIADKNASLIKAVVVIVALALTSASFAYLLFYFQGDAIITLIFAEKFAIISKYNEKIFLLAALKIAFAVLIIPVFLGGKIKALLMIESTFAAMVFIQITSIGLLANPVADALNVLIWSNAVSLGMLFCLVVFGAGPRSSSLAATQ